VGAADKAYYDRLLQVHAGKAPNVNARLSGNENVSDTPSCEVSFGVPFVTAGGRQESERSRDYFRNSVKQGLNISDGFFMLSAWSGGSGGRPSVSAIPLNRIESWILERPSGKRRSCITVPVCLIAES
jgi:hypothetical protein